MFGQSHSKFEDSINEEGGNGHSKFNAKTLLSSTLKFGIASKSQN
jgi:hypothetical protein